MDEIDLILELKARKGDHLARAAADALERNDIKHRDEIEQLRLDVKLAGEAMATQDAKMQRLRSAAEALIQDSGETAQSWPALGDLIRALQTKNTQP